MRALWLAAAVATLHTGVLAQNIYRCGPDGRIYQQAPCTDGRPIDASDPRTPEQRAAAQAVAAGEARRAAQFDRDNAPASAPERRRAKPPKATASAASSSAASAPKHEKVSARDPSKPLTVRLPAKPKAPASAASQ